MRNSFRLFIGGIVCAGLAIGCGETNKGTVPAADPKIPTGDVKTGKAGVKDPGVNLPPVPKLDQPNKKQG